MNKYRIVKGNTINGVALKPGYYTPRALVREMNRVLKSAGRPERYQYNADRATFSLIPEPPVRMIVTSR